MEIEVKDIDYCVVSVSCKANQEEIEVKKNEVVKGFSKRPVPGFRAGKKPDAFAIKMYYAKEIGQKLKQAMAEEAFYIAATEKGIKPFGVPDFKSLELTNNDKDFTCEFTVRKKPEVELGQYKGFELPKPALGITIDEAAQQMLQDLRIKYGEAVPYTADDFVQLSDNVVINYDVFDGDKKVDALSMEGELLTVGRSQLTGFDANLLGMKVGDVREFMLTLPNAALPSIAGKELKFVVSITMGSKIKPMPLDDSLAQKMEKKDLQELMQFATDFASAKVQEAQHQHDTAAIANKLVADHAIKVPDWLTTSEAQYIVARAQIDWSKLEPDDQAQYMKMAENNVKLSLLLDKIREDEPEAQLSDVEVIEMIRNMVGKMAKGPEEIDAMMQELNKTGQVSILSARIRDEFTQDFLLKNTKWIE